VETKKIIVGISEGKKIGLEPAPNESCFVVKKSADKVVWVKRSFGVNDQGRFLVRGENRVAEIIGEIPRDVTVAIGQ